MVFRPGEVRTIKRRESMTSVGQARGGATNRYSDEDSYNMAHASVGYVVDADLKAMQNLANNRSLRGTYQHP